MDLQRQTESAHEFIKQVKFDIFHDRIFVLTPKGDVYDLSDGSTPIDFAYAVHTDIGNHCSGARINDKIAALDAKLKNGDLVEIIIDKKRKSPSRDWLKFAKTHKARAKIRQFAPSTFESIKKLIPRI
jgi:GTP pyrophosphokinase